MPVRLDVLGPVQLTNGELKPIKGRKRQALLAYLLEARIANRPEVSKIDWTAGYGLALTTEPDYRRLRTVRDLATSDANTSAPRATRVSISTAV